MAREKVSIVIPNRSGLDHLEALFPDLMATEYEPLEVVVVDNASDDGSVRYLRSLEAPWPLTVIENEGNRTFSESCNQGASHATGSVLLFLNNDVRPLEPTWLTRMVDALADPQVVGVGAQLVYPPRASGAREVPRVQHRGIHFAGNGGQLPVPRNLGSGDSADDSQVISREAAALTAACLLVRREDFEGVGGFSESYAFGTEDVDLCLKLRGTGGRLQYRGDAMLFHAEFGTQSRTSRELVRLNRIQNRNVFEARWGTQLFRQVLSDRLEGRGLWSEDPFHVAITVTNRDPAAGWGDYYTAHELGRALEKELGWRVSYIQRYGDEWYETGIDFDAIVVLLDAFDLRRVDRGPITIAWVRNWTDRWLDRPWFDDFDIVLASSTASLELIESRSSRRAALFPLATNADRFLRGAPTDEHRCDVLFAGNYWDRPRDVEQVLPDLSSQFDVRLHGRGWEEHRTLSEIDRGHLPYEDLPDAYASARIVLDDTAEHTRPYGAVNSRVFDALAAGTVVITDNPVGAEEIFDDRFPVFTDPQGARDLVREFIRDEDARRVMVARYRPLVLARHTYARRARELQDILQKWCESTRVGILTSVPSRSVRESWGDEHFARGLQRAFERRGFPTTVYSLEDRDKHLAVREDLGIHLLGRSEHDIHPCQVSALWVISHPTELDTEACRAYDHVFAAGGELASELAAASGEDVSELRQATDPDRFSPRDGGPRHELLFVANSRGVPRKIIDDLLPTDHELAIYGHGWIRDLVPPRYVRGERVPNPLLASYYSAADIVLNDHWPDMREYGMYSNRIYDALAAGAFVISDHVDGLEEEFDGGVVSYRDAEELAALVDEYLDDDEKRRDVAERGRAAVLERHTFAHRVDVILERVQPILEQRPSLIV